MRDRLFVLAPLADLALHLVPPGWDETVGDRPDDGDRRSRGRDAVAVGRSASRTRELDRAEAARSRCGAAATLWRGDLNPIARLLPQEPRRIWVSSTALPFRRSTR